MPYKHIAAHLKKTELACRLHYHQLSHGSNRRKRTTSMSSGSSSTSHSPIMTATIPSPIHESPSRSVSPPGSLGGYGSSAGVQLPSIMSAGVGSHHNSPRLPAILPKPANMSLALSASRNYATMQQEHHHQQQQQVQQQQQHSAAPLLPAATFSTSSAAASPAHSHNTMAPLRLDCATPPSTGMSPQQHHHMPHHPQQHQQASMPHVDMGRLQAVYSSHRATFWSAVAAEYGQGAHPAVLEQAWKNNSSSSGYSGSYPSAASMGYSAGTPITPVGSPDERDLYSTKQDKTRISAILGIDANPRSPKEREQVRRLEERVMVGVGA